MNNVSSKCKCRLNHTCIYEEEDWNNFRPTSTPTWREVRKFSHLTECLPHRQYLKCYEMCPFCAKRCRDSVCSNYPKYRPLYSCQNSSLKEHSHAPLNTNTEQRMFELHQQHLDMEYFYLYTGSQEVCLLVLQLCNKKIVENEQFQIF